MLGEVLEATPPVGRADEGALVTKARARQVAPRLDAHLPCPAVDGAQLDLLEHAAVLARQGVEAARGEERAEREEDGGRPIEGITQDDGVLAAHEPERDLERAAGDVVGPARERVLVEALEVEGALIRIDARELVLGEVPLRPARRPRGDRGVSRGQRPLRDDGDVDVGEDDVAGARGIERGDEEAVVAASVHARERGAGVGARAVGVEPLAARAPQLLLHVDGGVPVAHVGQPASSARSAASRSRSRGGVRPVQSPIASAAWRTSMPRPEAAPRPRRRAASTNGVTRGL